MKALLKVFLLLISTQATHAIEVWHTETVWAGMGQCSAHFSFDGGGLDDALHDLRVEATLTDESGAARGEIELHVDEIGGSSVARYASDIVEGEELCGYLILTVTSATAQADGKTVDLLATRQLRAREFRPNSIRIGAP